jgi:2-methylisocitrate lyase-like PEP mutase family enzyme
MSPSQSAASRLRARLTEERPLLLPGCADALTARIAADVGFEALYATGAGISNALLGLPDVGLATMSEIVDQVGRMYAAVDVPIVADMDTGYGNPVNARRAVRAFEAAGAAGIQIEDQVFPKRCGHFSGKEVIPIEEMRAKVYAVLEGRRSPETVVIARTDAVAVEGAEAAIERANTYAEMGADLVFVEAPPTRELLAELPRRVRAPLVANMVEGGLTPSSSLAELGAMGYRVVLFANTALRASMLAAQSALSVLHEQGDSASILDDLLPWEERQRLVGKPELDAFERRYSVRDPEPDSSSPSVPSTSP